MSIFMYSFKANTSVYLGNFGAVAQFVPNCVSYEALVLKLLSPGRTKPRVALFVPNCVSYEALCSETTQSGTD